MPANIVIPPNYWPVDVSITFRLTDEHGLAFPAEITDNSGWVAGRKTWLIGEAGATITIPCNDELPSPPGKPAGSFWHIIVGDSAAEPNYHVQISSASPPTTWNELIEAGAPVDPADVWSGRLLPADALPGQWTRKAAGPGWEAVDAPAGSGDVSGPASAADGNMAVFDGPTGKVIKDGGPPGGGGVAKGAPFVIADLLAVESDIGDGQIQTVGFPASDVARLSIQNVFSAAPQRIQTASTVGFCLFQTGTPGEQGRWKFEAVDGLIYFRSTDDSGINAGSDPELTIGHANNPTQNGVIVGGPAFQGAGTLSAENGLFDGAQRVYSPANPPPASGWQDGATIGYWNLTTQALGNISGAAVADLDNGAVITAAMTADTTITFSSTAGMTNMPFWLRLTMGGFTPTFAFAGKTFHAPDGLVLSDGIWSFSFMMIGADIDYWAAKRA